ncbi:MAG: phospho-sugar mutase [Puniceicoccales bacterium]|nr:phospho-sugar mutase [Puniceicoccales bacterium]
MLAVVTPPNVDAADASSLPASEAGALWKMADKLVHPLCPTLWKTIGEVYHPPLKKQQQFYLPQKLLSSGSSAANLKPMATDSWKGKLPAEAEANFRSWRSAGNLPGWAGDSMEWLAERGQWDELNDRFFQNLQFGTGGMRGRAIGAIVTPMEGDAGSGKYVRSAIGSATMNDITVARAAIALHRHCDRWLREEGGGKRPKLIVAYDVRYFSRHFGQITCSLWNLLGGEALLFDGARSTPELSFAVRRLSATAGVVITASHNPFYDNGFKAYFRDGAQVIDPHAAAIMENYGNVTVGEACELLGAAEMRPKTFALPCQPIDKQYVTFLRDGVVDWDSIGAIGKPIVYTSLHGVGSAIMSQLIDIYGLPIVQLGEQCICDPRFPTVPSPNPENPAALSSAMARCDAISSDFAIGADPDADRMALAYRGRDGKMRLLSGNETAVLLAERRLRALFSAKKLNVETARGAALVRSLVTTPLLDAIGESYGVRTVKTPVGFKWVGEKLQKWEVDAIEMHRTKTGMAVDFESLDEDERREFLLKYSSYLVLGAEESCGYGSLGETRDKDSHCASIMAAEAYGSLLLENLTVDDFFDGIYRRFGYHGSKLHTISFSGADGANKIRSLLASIRENPYKSFAGKDILSWSDLERDGADDGDGGRFFAGNFFVGELSDGFSVAIRGSGTEAKVKFYFFFMGDGEDIGAAKRYGDGQFAKMVAFAERDVAGRTANG